MKNALKLIAVLFVMNGTFVSCNFEYKVKQNMEQKTNDTQTNDTTPKATGVGGIFFFSENPKEIRAWYKKNLGIDANDYGASFESRSLDKPDEINTLQWSPFKKGSEYFAPSKKEFMINYRVQNIEGLVAQLKANGVNVLDSIETFDYGKFVHIMDNEGNKIELWEPSGN
jgi:predicted enzyme related to lactoylglutathione lyase